MIPIASIISNGLGAIKEFFGFQRVKLERSNTPEMKGNAKAERDARIVDEARKDVAEGDEDAIRKGLS